MAITFRTEEALLATFEASKGDIDKQIAAFLRAHPGYEERIRRESRSSVDVAFSLSDRPDAVQWVDHDFFFVMSAKERADLNRYFRDHVRIRSRRPERAAAWVRRCIAYGERMVDAGADEASRSLFWIHLWEVLGAIRVWARETRAAWSEPEGIHPDDPTPQIAELIDEAAEVVSTSLTARDIVTVIYFRHHAAHFSPAAFSFQAPGKLTPLGRPPTDEELDALHLADEPREATSIAGKVLEPLGLLRQALEHWPSPTVPES